MRQQGLSRRLPLRHFISLFLTAIFPSVQSLMLDYYHHQHNGQQKSAKIVDPILGARCDVKCWNQPSNQKSSCLSSCLEEPWIKPGICPARNTAALNADFAFSLERACVNSCKSDNECSGILKCCEHSCGVTCQTPLQMNAVVGVPTLSGNITIDINKENPAEDGIVIIVRWNEIRDNDHNNSNYNGSKTIYILEERHHVGRQFVEERLSDWVIKRRSIRPKVTIKNLYRPGRWYVFRITAVNENGTKGPSQPSKPFFAAVSPKVPEMPANLKVGATSWGNGKLHLQLIWKAPNSDLPIHKYKVTYSRLKNFTLIQHHHSLPPSTTYFWLKELEPNTEYFLQVQAFSKFGKRRLAGETASIVFNTAQQHRHTNRSTYSSDKKIDNKYRPKYKRKIRNFKVDKIYWLRDQLLATITWTSVRSSQIYYYVRWAHNGCLDNNRKSWYIAKTDMTTFEVYDLLPQCEYTISIKATWQETLYRNKMIFNTNNCRKNNSTLIPSSIIIDCPYSSTSSAITSTSTSSSNTSVTSRSTFIYTLSTSPSYSSP